MANASPTDVISNWSTLIENLETSPLGFFESVELALQRRAVPNVESSRVDYHESGIVSAKREYLRIKRDRLLFDICASPYGNGFFVSWWLGAPKRALHPIAVVGIILGYFLATYIAMNVLGIFLGLLFAAGMVPVILATIRAMAEAETVSDDFLFDIPGIAYVYKRFFKPDTYYAIDTETMFQTATHAAVLEAIDQLTSSRGLRALSESERKPTLRRSLKG